MEQIRQRLLSHFQYYHRLWKLNYRVRDENGCGLPDIVAGKGRAAHISAPTAQVVARVTRQRSALSSRFFTDHCPLTTDHYFRSIGYMRPSIRPLVPVS